MSKEECLAAFWETVAEELVNLHDKGLLPAPPESLPEAA